MEKLKNFLGLGLLGLILAPFMHTSIFPLIMFVVLLVFVLPHIIDDMLS